MWKKKLWWLLSLFSMPPQCCVLDCHPRVPWCELAPLLSLHLLQSQGAEQSLRQKTTRKLISVTQLLAEPSDCWFICSNAHPLTGRVSLRLLHLLFPTDSPLPLLSPPRLTLLWMPVASSHGGGNSHTPVSVLFFSSFPPPRHIVVNREHNRIPANSSFIFPFFPLDNNGTKRFFWHYFN